MKKVFCSLLVILMAPAIYAQTSNTLTPKEKSQGWILLFDGTSSNGWTTPSGKAVPTGLEWLKKVISFYKNTVESYHSKTLKSNYSKQI